MPKKQINIEDLKGITNNKSFRIICDNANERIVLLTMLIKAGIRWHGEGYWTTAIQIEEAYPWREFDTVDIDPYNHYMQGNRSRYMSKGMIHFKQFMEVINE